MPRHCLKTGPDRGYRVFADWQGTEPCGFETADSLPEFCLHLLDARRASHLLTLRGSFAARLLCILDERLRDIRDSDFNCFASVETLAVGGRPRSDLLHRDPLGSAFGRDEPLPDLEPPFVFQMHGEWLGDDEMRREGIIHEGVVLHPTAAAGEPLVFHKCGPLRPEITPWRQALLMYRRSKRLHYGQLLRPSPEASLSS
ncbi:MAG: hypothetical protein KBC95_03965 [Candidatus Peribacteraceae bacterium]|nr:hypothetical protein [Candidatus Peribacteraceae bacterium]